MTLKLVSKTASQSLAHIADCQNEQRSRDVIQGYIGPDHNVIDMKAFCSALVQALKNASR